MKKTPRLAKTFKLTLALLFLASSAVFSQDIPNVFAGDEWLEKNLPAEFKKTLSYVDMQKKLHEEKRRIYSDDNMMRAKKENAIAVINERITKIQNEALKYNTKLFEDIVSRKIQTPLKLQGVKVYDFKDYDFKIGENDQKLVINEKAIAVFHSNNGQSYYLGTYKGVDVYAWINATKKFQDEADRARYDIDGIIRVFHVTRYGKDELTLVLDQKSTKKSAVQDEEIKQKMEKEKKEFQQKILTKWNSFENYNSHSYYEEAKKSCPYDSKLPSEEDWKSLEKTYNEDSRAKEIIGIEYKEYWVDNAKVASFNGNRLSISSEPYEGSSGVICVKLAGEQLQKAQQEKQRAMQQENEKVQKILAKWNSFKSINNGKTYTYGEALKACPSGSYLPSDKEWESLGNELKGNESLKAKFPANNQGTFWSSTYNKDYNQASYAEKNDREGIYLNYNNATAKIQVICVKQDGEPEKAIAKKETKEEAKEAPKKPVAKENQKDEAKEIKKEKEEPKKLAVKESLKEEEEEEIEEEEPKKVPKKVKVKKDSDEMSYKIGLRAGLNNSKMEGLGDKANVPYNYKLGFQGGLSLETNYFQIGLIQTGLMLSQKGTVIDDGSFYSEITSYYIEVPLMYSYKIPNGDNLTFSLDAGVYLARGIRQDITSTINGSKAYEENANFNESDYGLRLCAGIEFSESYYAGIFGNYGLANNEKTSLFSIGLNLGYDF